MGSAYLTRTVPLVVVFVISLVMLFSPASTVPTDPPVSDKVVHGLLFAALAAASLLARIPWWTTILWLAGYAVISEVLQAALPIGRSGDLADVLADLIGAAVATAIGAAWLVWRSSRGARSRERT